MMLSSWIDVENYIKFKINDAVEEETLSSNTIWDLVNGRLQEVQILENFEEYYINNQDHAEGGIACCDWCMFEFTLNDHQLKLCQEYLFKYLVDNHFRNLIDDDDFFENHFKKALHSEQHFARYIMIKAVWNKFKRDF